MRVIFINRKKVGIIVILMGLMITLLGISKGFDKQLKTTILVEHNINLLNDYTALNGKVNYKLPEGWTTKEKKLPGGEIIYHNDFQSSDAVIHGFVEVWRSKNDLKAFLDSSKKISEEQNLVKNYKLDSIIINGKKTYLVQYLISITDNNWYKAYEYFIDDGNEFYRISFFTRNVNFKESFGAIYESIVETFKIN
ncbi:hypothetical protein LGL55_16560 [Clostridium tagluense]|uniref:hypothetical protein n=1 Tax=Clostridium tagluense TaxID=360422 RepID=UPI001CF39094|nr:hypothetical protein [Clostridium tagluense]MCB2312847.1 hypothetical protein [Clostridium tagluense]MCB2317613.1 hypothetical protein [Clostridium tagluense]MCB2322430.1 hypothetical protein [Clostridium tagluense]MCB2327433.1 hypothetical protein [Clostridium tagluense]MCB2332115.1 hypothetical protein [Clostridium tagluense]